MTDPRTGERRDHRATGADARDPRGLPLAERARLLTGEGFWGVRGVPAFGLAGIVLADGPHGVRRQSGSADHLGVNDAETAVCFPPACALAASFDPALLERLGAALGAAARQAGVALLLGPGINIKRSPLCGRNFEYFSEDPYLGGTLAAALVRGIQSQGVGACVKHFAANNQESARMTLNAVVDERTLREIYLPAFETVVREAAPWAVMAAYNRLNGRYLCESRRLLDGVLREEWGFDGLVLSDWGAVDELAAAVAAGMDLEMPDSGDMGPGSVLQAVAQGRLAESAVNASAGRVMQLLARAARPAPGFVPQSPEQQHALARAVAGECIVLLKNDDGVLPLDPARDPEVALLGALARTPRIQGGGSSRVNPWRVENAHDELIAAAPGIRFRYAPGYTADAGAPDAAAIAEAAALAAQCSLALVFVGLGDADESEGVDRVHLDLPAAQLALLDAVVAANPRTVVVVSAGCVVRMPFAARVPAILHAWLLGEAGGGAVADVLLGRVDPGGRLPESFIARLEDDPARGNFPGDGREVRYAERLAIGYRAHDRRGTALAFPFGHGLSYTRFAWSALRLDRPALGPAEPLRVTLDIENTGSRTGTEVVQLYVAALDPVVERPPKELRRYAKRTLAPGERARLAFELDARCFARYDAGDGAWRVDGGTYRVMLARSATDVVLQQTVEVRAERPTAIDDTPRYPDAVPLAPGDRIDRNTPIGALHAHPLGRFLRRAVLDRAAAAAPASDGQALMSAAQLRTVTDGLPLRCLASMSAGRDLDARKLARLIRLLDATRPATRLGRVLGWLTGLRRP